MKLHLEFTGLLLILLSMFHGFFPKRFEWKKDLAGLSLINRQMMYVHMFFVALTVFLMGVLCCCCAEDLAGTWLGKKVALGMAVFWGLRLIFQFFVYSSELWRGKRFETVVHLLFSMLWAYFTLVFFLVSLE